MENSSKLLGWDAMVDALSGEHITNPLISSNFSTSLDEEMSNEEIAKLQRTNKAPSVKAVFGIEPTIEEENDDDEEEEELEIEEPKVKKASKKVEPAIEPIEEIDEELGTEGIQVTSFFDAIVEELGVESEDLEEKKPETVEELVSYFRELIEENSIPEYANEQVKEIDEYIRNGGDLNTYFSIRPNADYDNFDITVESNQKQIIRELLTEKGYNEKSISRKIEKYEDAGILEDEAEDALETMKEVTVQKKERLLEAQKKEHTAKVERQQTFVADVVGNIKTLKDIRGIAIPEKDKQVLLNYIFKADTNGMTQYQKDYSKSVKNLIESAYFTMKGDTLLDTAKKLGTSSAMKNLKQSLKNNGAVTGTKRINTSSSNSIWSSAVRNLTNI